MTEKTVSQAVQENSKVQLQATRDETGAKQMNGQTMPVENSPLYTKWWLWLIIVIVVGAGAWFLFM